MNPAVFLTFIAFLIVGCASHGNWSKWDSGAWTTLGTSIGSNDKNYYVEHWGEPVSQRESKTSDDNGNVRTDGEELIWLWKPDGTNLSDMPGQGWELILVFDLGGKFSNWQVGKYRTTLTVPDVIAVSRKHMYRFENAMLAELILSDEQHGVAEARYKQQRLCMVNPEYCRARKLRLDEVVQLQEVVRVIAAATFDADTAARNLHDRLASDSEVLALLESKKMGTAASPSRRRSSTTGTSTTDGSDGSSSGLLGRGFLGPATPNAYGPGINSDATGRPFIWRPDFGGPALGPIQPNAYGPGVGMDATGRPVRPACPPGWAGPC